MSVVVFLLQVAAGVQNSLQYLSPQVPDPRRVLRSPGPVFIVSLKKPPITNSRELFLPLRNSYPQLCDHDHLLL